MVHQDSITLRTSGHGDMHCVHEDVNRIIRESGIRMGTVQVFNVGSTGAVGAIEYEPGLTGDLPEILNHLMPPGTHYGRGGDGRRPFPRGPRAEDNTIRLALIGCGGRGNGAVGNAMNTRDQGPHPAVCDGRRA
jgi:hypothetical protein